LQGASEFASTLAALMPRFSRFDVTVANSVL
jgi:hypothetical protein